MRRGIILWLLAAACSGSSQEGEHDTASSQSQTPPPTVVAVHTVQTARVNDRLEASGSVEATKSAVIVPQTTGRVTKVTVKLGDTVKKGDLLAVLQNEVADTTVSRTQEEVDHLASQLQELEALLSSGAVAQTEVSTARFNLEQARSRLREARVGTQHTRLVAPFSGVVAKMDLKVGELATSTTTALQVVDLHTLQVRANLPEQDLARVQVGQEATLSSAFDASQQAHATLTRIAPIVDRATGTFEVILTLDSDQHTLRPGQYVRISLIVDHRDSVLTVPREAVVWENGRSLLWRVTTGSPPPATTKEDSPTTEKAVENKQVEGEPYLVVHQTFVEIGLNDEARAEILQGVEAGDKIVVTGHAALRDNSHVVIAKPGSAREGSDG